MSECPQGTCNGIEKVKEHMVTKATIKWAFGLFMSIMIAFGIAWGSLRIEVTKNTTHFEHIQKSLDDIQSTQKAMWRSIKDLSE